MTLRFVSVVGGDTSLLAYSLAHYRELGVESFHLVRHLEREDDPDLERSAAVLRDAGCEFVRTAVGPWHEDLNARLIREVMRSHPDDWWVVADLDEFHVYDRPLGDVIAYCEARGHDHVEGALLDRVSADGSLTDLAPPGSAPLWRQYPMAGLLTLRLLGARPTKVTLARGAVHLDLGQHCAWTGSGAPVEEIYAQVHHFKWTASVRARLARRVAAYSSGEWRLEHRSITDESRAVLDHIDGHGGRIDVGDPAFAFVPCSSAYAGYPAWAAMGPLMRERFQEYDRARRPARYGAAATTGRPR